MRIRVNVRQGPGAAYPKVGELDRNVKVIIVGKSEDAKWFQVPYEANKTGWVASDFVDVTGSIAQVQVVAVQPPPPTLTATTTRVVTGTATPKPTATLALLPPTGRIYFIAQQSDSYVASWFQPDKKEQVFNEVRISSLNSPPADLKPDLATNAAPFDWSEAAGKLAYVLNDGSQDKLRTDVEFALDSHGGISSPRWSPDGSQIAYIGMDSGFKSQSIYSISASGGNQRVLLAARNGEQFKGLAWSRKNAIAFVSNFSGRFEIWTCLASDCSTPTKVTNDNADASAPAWSPDGNRIAYVSNKSAPTEYQIYLMNSDGTNVTRLGAGFTPTFSQDGNWLALSRNASIYYMDVRGGTISPALNLGTHPVWAP
jgi:Tol biopolymer transport system component